MTHKMHPDEILINEMLVRKLLKEQFPKWSDLPLQEVVSGTQNAIYRLGKDMAIRLPRIPGAVSHINKEYLYLPKLAPHLSLSIPTPIAKGKPSNDYPWDWSIYAWLDGENAVDTITDLHQAAIDLGHFVKELHDIAPTGGHLCRRGKPLHIRDKETREAIALLEDIIDTNAATTIWEKALSMSQWELPPVWIHGDLHTDNMLTTHGRISAVIDFGSAGIGDPAVDMMVAWTALSADTRNIFRNIVQPDEATWIRGRGWALTFGLVALPYYTQSNPTLADISRRTIDAVFSDQ
ncbi:MAG: aminoglycoside phosphotransferase family protein [Patescibacteria group bacterium]